MMKPCAFSLLGSFTRKCRFPSIFRLYAMPSQAPCSTWNPPKALLANSIGAFSIYVRTRVGYSTPILQHQSASTFHCRRPLSVGPDRRHEEQQELTYIYRNTLLIIKEALRSTLSSMTSVRTSSPNIATGLGKPTGFMHRLSQYLGLCISLFWSFWQFLGPEMKTISLALSTLLLTTPITLFFPSAVGQVRDLLNVGNLSFLNFTTFVRVPRSWLTFPPTPTHPWAVSLSSSCS